jgi:hypothetical protein
MEAEVESARITPQVVPVTGGGQEPLVMIGAERKPNFGLVLVQGLGGMLHSTLVLVQPEGPPGYPYRRSVVVRTGKFAVSAVGRPSVKNTITFKAPGSLMLRSCS